MVGSLGSVHIGDPGIIKGIMGSLSLCVSIFVCLSLPVSVSVSISPFLHLCLSLFLSLSLSVFVCVYVSDISLKQQNALFHVPVPLLGW